MNNIEKLFNENNKLNKNCNLCNETNLQIGDSSEYGAIIIFKIGSALENGWFATLSPKTGGNIHEDFSIQLMPFAHLTHFSQLHKYPELAKNYGMAFAKICKAMTTLMKENPNCKIDSNLREESISIATYGKCTTWKEKKEHLHLKIFQFSGPLGQPSTVDSSFGRKKIYRDSKNKEFIKMDPVYKKDITSQRLKILANKLIQILK